ncbi:MAG: outer membrane beta-barrel protein [Verrucomicrobiota bacterium]
MKKLLTFCNLLAFCLIFVTGKALAIETVQTDSTDPAAEAQSLLQDGIVEEVSAEDFDYYGFTPEEKFPIRARLRLEGYYDSNIFTVDTGKTDDFVWEIQPDVYYELGSAGSTHNLVLGYNPTFFIFTDNSSENAFNNGGYGRYTYTADKTVLGISHSTAEVDGANSDVGARVSRTEHLTRIFGNYQYSEKLVFEGEAGQSLRYYDLATLADYHDWYGQGFFLYEVSPKIQLGLGTKFGFVDIGLGPNQTYQQALIKMVYAASEKLQFTASAGAEFRQYQDPRGWEDRVTPAASLGLGWTPFDSTEYTMTVFRNISPSISIIGANSITTGFNSKIRQRLLNKVFYSLSGGFNYAEYRPTVVGTVNNREDFYFNVRNALEYKAFKYGSIGIYYEYQDNSTLNAGSDFVRHVTGVQVNLEY